MYKQQQQSDDGPISPMKKLKILSEQQNVLKPRELNLKPIKENIVVEPASEIEHDNEPEHETEIEPLLQESTSQYVIFPINHKDMWYMYKHFVDNFWTVTETVEELDKLNLTYDETQFMKYFSSFFAAPQSQGLVINTFAEDLCKLVQVTEAKFFYGHQLFIQNIHYEMYNKLLDKFVATTAEREKFNKIVEEYDAVINKRNWISTWNKASFGDKILASACIHGLFFISLDLLCEWLKNKTKALLSHELIDIIGKMIIDQELQRDFACLMLNTLKSKPSKERIIEMINQSAKVEFDFILNGLKIDLIKTETDDIIQLIDKKTKSLKAKIFGSMEQKKSSTASMETKTSTKNEETYTYKENKAVFDEDF